LRRASSKEALEKLSDDPRIEVLLTDINMPGMDGCELAETAVQMRRRLKVIVLSGREMDVCGYPFIRKPFSQNDLERTMSQNTGLS
jgi:CheY-like chemotaxis protein